MRGRRRQEQGGGGARVQVREKPAGAGNRLPGRGRDLALIGSDLHCRMSVPSQLPPHWHSLPCSSLT